LVINVTAASARVVIVERSGATVMGGSQAISRSLFSRMIPLGREASFYGLYEISERGTSWIGPFMFGAADKLACDRRRTSGSMC
jgi:UMF1 family MFS transporter